MNDFLRLSITMLLSAVCSLSHSQNLALNFDGFDDFVNIPDNNIYNVGTGNFTFESWIRMDMTQAATFPSILSKRLSTNSNSGFLIMVYQGKLFFQAGGTNIGQGTINIQDNACHHIAIVRNNGTVSFYVDGVLDGTFSNVTQSISSNHNLWVGKDELTPNTTRFKGTINEVRYWTIARTQTQIQASIFNYLNGNESGLAGYWKLNDGSGQTVNDFSTNNNDGFLGATVNVDVTDPAYTTGCLSGCIPPVASISSNGTVLCTASSILLTATTGTGYTYQWVRNGNNISGATSSTYSATISGTYSCTVTANGCSVSTNAIVITSSLFNVFLNYSGPTTFCTGSSLLITRSVTSGAGTSPTFQWLKDGNAIPGATDTSYNTTQTGAYSVRVTNTQTGCIVTSFQLNVTVQTGLPSASINAIPNDTSCGSVLLMLAQTGAGLSYQWQRNSIDITGAVNSYIDVPSTGNYRCVVTNSCGSSNSNVINAVLLGTGPITASGSTSFCSGSVLLTALFIPGATYQWYNNNYLIPGATGQSYNATTAGSYSCTYYTINCGTQYSTNEITVTAPGGILAVNSTTTCIGPVDLVAFGGTGATYQWQLNGSNIQGANSFSYAAAVSGVYSCEITTVQCGTSTSNLIPVTIGQTPQISLVPSPLGFNTFDVCNFATEIIALPANQGDYIWTLDGYIFNPIQSGPSNILSGPPTGYYSVSLVTSCGTTSEFFTVRNLQTQLEVTSSEGSGLICSPLTYLEVRPAYVSLPYSPQWGSYQWKLNGINIPGANAPTLYPSQDGMYSCTVSNSCGIACCVDSLAVTIIPPIVNTVTASGPLTFCVGQSVDLSVPFQTGNTYLWYRNNLQLGITTNTINITSAGTYKVRIQNACSTVYSADQVVTTTQNMNAVLDADNPLYNCNNLPLLLSATTGNGYTYEWFKNNSPVPNAVGSFYVATETGSYYAKVIKPNGCYKLTNVQQVAIGNSLPVITTTATLPVCFGQNISFSANAFGPGNTYQWKLNGVNLPNGTGSGIQMSAEAGNLSVEVTNVCGTQVSAPYVISVNPVPPSAITAAGPVNFCAPGSVVLNANTGAGISYQWQGPSGSIAGATSPTYTATVTGNYSVRENYTGTTCFKYSNVIFVNSTNIQPVLTPASPVYSCNSPVLLTAPTGAGYTYQWKNGITNISGATSSTYNAINTGTYSVVITNSCGSITSPSTSVTILNSAPSATISTSMPTSFCQGPAGYAWLVTTNIVGTTYQWQRNGSDIAGATSNQYQAFSTGSYTCIKSNVCGTVTSNAINITAKQLPVATISAAGPTNFCPGGSVNLNASTGTGYTYEWKKNNLAVAGTASTFNATSGGTYTCVVSRPNGCSLTSNYVNVTVTPLTAAVIPQGATSICPGTSVTLKAYPAGASSYQWKKFGNNIAGATGPTFIATKKGNYSVVVTNSCGTSTSPNAKVSIISNPVATITAGGPTTFCAGQNVVLTANNYAGVTYQWQKNNVNLPLETLQSYTATTSGNYRVRETANGCHRLSNTITVTVNCRESDPDAISFDPAGITLKPNPFTQSAILKIDEADDINGAYFEIYDISGKKVRGPQPVDGYEITINRDNLDPGLYLVRLITLSRSSSVVKFMIE